MLEALVYGAALACFGFVILATARLPPGMLVVACIPAVFVAIVMGFVMAIYAGDTFGLAWLAGALVPSVVGAWRMPRFYGPRDQLIAIYLVWAVGLVFTMIGVAWPDDGQ